MNLLMVSALRFIQILTLSNGLIGLEIVTLATITKAYFFITEKPQCFIMTRKKAFISIPYFGGHEY